MNLVRWYSKLLFFTALATAPLPALGQMVRVISHAFCRDVANLNPVGVVTDAVDLRPSESLHLWLEIGINPAGLKYLRAVKKLPVYIRWGRDGWLTDPAVDVGITSESWAKNSSGIIHLASTKEGGWRTAARKTASIGGRYYVSVLDANKKVITSIEFPSDPFRPEIEVTLDRTGEPNGPVQGS